MPAWWLSTPPGAYSVGQQQSALHVAQQLADALGFSEDQIVVNPCGIGGDFGGKSPAERAPGLFPVPPLGTTRQNDHELHRGVDGRQSPASRGRHHQDRGEKRRNVLGAAQHRGVQRRGLQRLQGPPRTRRQPGRGRGQYHIPHFQVDSYMVYTNNVPCGSYRAPGQPQVVFAVESHTDMIAHEMGIDPYALRLRNVLQDGQVCATGGRYKHVRGEATLRAAVEAANWGAPKSGPVCWAGHISGAASPGTERVLGHRQHG